VSEEEEMQKKHGRTMHGKYKFKAMLRIRMHFMRILIQAKISMLIRIQLQQAQLIEKCKGSFYKYFIKLPEQHIFK
jgi:hypothetical protein